VKKSLCLVPLLAPDINLSEEDLMLKYITRRLLTYIPLLFALTLISFLYVHLMPGDPVKAMAGQYATPETILKIQHELGLDRPLIDQYLSWMGGIFKGDFGISFITRKPITSYI
jgi:peptide/nickel transport system permease protein